MATPIGDKFDSLPSEEQWKYVLGLEMPRTGITIMLDNDATDISFGEKDDEGDQDYVQFKSDCGDREGVYDLLKSLGFDVNYV